MKRPLTNLLLSVTLVCSCSSPALADQGEKTPAETDSSSALTEKDNKSDQVAAATDGANVQSAESNRLLAQEEVKLRDGSGIGSSPNSSGTTSGTAARGNTSPIPSAPKTSSRSWGARLSSFVAGSIVGVPICLVRRTYFETKTGALDLAGPHSNPVLLGATAAFSLPYAVCGGFLEAVPCSVMNSWHGSAEEPFSKDAFSLGEGQ